MTCEVNNRIDEFEALLLKCEPVDCPLKHYFIDGGYVREIFMPAGTFVTSLIHKTRHPFAILEGKVSVYSENDGVQLLEAGYRGITIPFTRRVLYVHENCVWVTFHKTDIKPKDDSETSVLEAVELIGKEIIDWRVNPLIGRIVRNNIFPNILQNEN